MLDTHCVTASSSQSSNSRRGCSAGGERNWTAGAAVLVCMLSAQFLVRPVSAADEGGTVYQRAVVVADHPLASQAGLKILQQGGNVVDAAVATSFTLAVVRPASCGLGGGGFMVIWDARRKRSVALDYRERAPRDATRDMFLDSKQPRRPNGDLSRKGGLAVAVPGTVAGLCYALEHYGTLDLKAVLAPAIQLARDGYVPEAHQREVQQATIGAFQKRAESRDHFSALWRQYLNRGQPWGKDERFHSPLQRVLELIAAHGADGFYRGDVAAALVAEIRRRGGLLTLDDLAGTKPVVREPIQGKFGDCELISMPPPSSGGTALIEIVNILAAYEQAHPESALEKLGRNSPAYVHLVTEAMKHAFADRAEFLGDTDFADVPIERLTDRAYAAKLAGRINPNRTLPLESYGRFLPVEDSGTSHFSILDAEGNAVACTETINTTFGSYVVEPQFGIVLNNEMDDFAAVPGEPNAFGLIQSEANAVAAGKKPLSSMSPTILLQDGRAQFVAGASGGPRIISATLQVLLNMARFGLSPEEAVHAPRFHHQWLPNELYAEAELFEQLREPLEQKGHVVVRRSDLAVSQAAARSQTGLQGASDPRKHGRAAGF